jgi:hypothetical protein
MEKKPFRTWRIDRLQKMREQKEVKNEDAAVALSMSSANSVALETDSKPRTVSFEEGEDDTATPAYTTIDDAYVSKHIESDQNPKDEVLALVEVTFVYSAMLGEMDVDTYNSLRDGDNSERFSSPYKPRVQVARSAQDKIDDCYFVGKRIEPFNSQDIKRKVHFLFLFLPRCKEKVYRHKISRRLLRLFLCLCDLGWGPPVILQGGGAPAKRGWSPRYLKIRRSKLLFISLSVV